MTSDLPAAASERRGAARRAWQIVGDLLEYADEHDLPPVEWVISACGGMITGRCHASRDRQQRHADFEAWVGALDLRAEAHAAGGMTRLRAAPRKPGDGPVIEMTADLLGPPGQRSA